jgi:hypothetical protein
MPETEILVKIVTFFLAVVGFVFSFLAYTVAIRPELQKITSDYTLGFVEGGIIFFVIVGLPLTYAYLVERKKKKSAKK